MLMAWDRLAPLMCRLFGLLGSEPMPADAWLTGTERSLLAQSHVDEESAQRDGWGIGWYGSTRTPRVEKGIAGAFEPSEVGRFREISAQARGPVVIGHLRRASNPMNLPKARLIGPENSQPFSFESTLFAHNGCVPYPRETRPLLGNFEPKVRGVNDSEILFFLLLRHLEDTSEPAAAFGRAVQDLTTVWERQGRPGTAPFNGLNVLFTRGPGELWAFCRWNGEHGGSFYDPGRPYYQLAYRADAKHVVIGSEPFDGRSDWRSLENGEFLHVQSSHGLVATRTGRIPIVAATEIPGTRP
jgi:predicted glutamine amidotransferase